MIDNPPCETSAPLSYLAELGGALHAERLVVLRAYLDETRLPARIFALAGYVFTLQGSDQFAPQWNDVLRWARISEFHMKHFMHRKGEFEGWDEERRQALLNRLAPIIWSHAKFGVVSILDLESFETISAEEGFVGKNVTQYTVAVSFLLQQVALANDEEGPTAYILDEMVSNQGKTLLDKAWRWLKREPKLAELLGIDIQTASFSWAPSNCIPELQAADWLVYECAREQGRRLGRDTKLGDKPRESAVLLMGSEDAPRMYGCSISGEQIRRLAAVRRAYSRGSSSAGPLRPS